VRALPRRFALALGLAFAAVTAGAGPATAGAAPAPQPAPAVAAVPDKPEHTEFTVETNAKGQVTRVRSGKPSPDPAFNAMTYGNALQAFIRTDDGRAVAGVFRLTYDYDPASKRVRRGVALIHAGGVDPSALGAVDAMAAADRKAHDAKKTKAFPSLGAITGGNR
jgi:hypothetical protein